MANEFKVKNGLIVIGDLTTSGTITINGALAATQSWVTSQAYLTSASLSGYATQSYVTSAISALIDAAPAALDTLNELAAALGDDASFSTTVTNSIAGKVAKSGDTMTGSLTFASTADNVRIQKNSSFLNLRDPYNNIHLYNAGDGTYIDANVHHWRSQGASYWMTLNGTGLGIGTQSPSSKLTVYSDTTADGILVDVLSRPRITLRDRGNSDTILGTGDYGLDDFFIDTYSGNAFAIKGSTRNVGIGTTTPTHRLTVAGGNVLMFPSDNTRQLSFFNDSYGITASSGLELITGDYIRFRQGSTELARVTTTGLGIGVSNPTATLSLGASAYDGNPLTALQYTQVTGGGRLDLKVQTWGTGSNYGLTTGLSVVTPGFDTAEVRVGIGTTSPATPLHVTGGASGSGGWNRTATLAATYPGLIFNSNGTKWGGMAYDYSAAMRFWVNANNDDIFAGTLAMSILNNGNVGIGTSNPSYKLDVAGGDIILSSNATYIRSKDASGNTPRMFGINPSNDTYIGPIDSYAGGAVFYGVSANVASQTFYTGATARLHIASGGNVGIGTTSPNYKLDVNGSINIYTGNSLRWGSGDAEIINSGYNLLFKTYNGSALAEAMRINSAGKVSIGTTDTNSDKSDFTVYTGSGASIALVDDQVRMGGADVNWGVALRSYGSLQTYGQTLNLTTQAGNYPVIIQPNGVSSVSFYQSESYINTYTRINYNYGGGDYGAEALTIRGTYPSITLRSTNANFKWLLHTDASGNFRWYTGSEADNNAWTNRFTFGIDNNFYVDYGHVYASGGNSTQWSTAYSWGNHAGLYLPLTGGTMSGAITVNLGNVSSDTVAFKVGGPSNYDSLTIGMEDTPDYDAFIASYGNDIRFYSGKNVGTENHSFHWYTSKAGTAQHSQVAMLLDHNQNLTVTGGVYVSGGNSSNWNTAYGWGNHASAGYLTSYSETDTLASVTGRGASTSTAVTFNGGVNLAADTGIRKAGDNWIIGYSTSLPGIAIGSGTVTDKVSISSGGTQRVWFDTNGNVGIGTASPTEKLHVNGDTRIVGNTYVGGIINAYQGDASIWVPNLGQAFTVKQTTGNVGVGTSTPSEKLHVSGAAIFDGGSGNSSTDSVVYITKSNNSDWGLYVNASGLDYGMYARVSPSAEYALSIHNGTAWTTRITGNAIVYLGEKNAIEGNYDSWLRLNNSNHYTSGVYTPGVMRADGGFNVSGNTVWHAANDGSGSGLDADTVDGVQADSIVYGNARGTNDSVTTNNNDLDKTGYYTSDSFATKPSGVANWMYIEHIKLYNANTAYQKQLGYDTYDDRMWVRTKSGGAWSSWKQIWTSDSLTNLSQLTNGPGYITSSALSGYATTSYVTTQINNLINGAPGVLDTLDELAAALGDDANFATTVTNSIAGKMPYYHGAIGGDPGTAINGVTRIYPSVNGPSGGAHFTVFTAMQDNNFYGWQFTALGNDAYFRSKDTVYGGWNRLWSNSDFTSTSISNWNTAYGWGDHSSVGYALNSSLANYLPLSGGVIGGAVTINGNLTVNGTITENSSIKLKENVETSEGNLEKVVNLRPVTYNKIGSQTTELGLIAEEVAEVYPEFVQYDENGEPIGVHYSRLTAALIGAVKELNEQLQELKRNK